MAHEEEARKEDQILEVLRRDLEAARYAARRAQKQYDAADPDNRLVADELERRWNQGLQRVEELGRRIEQHLQPQHKTLAPKREEFAELAAELEAVWDHPKADARLKKRIVRTLIHEVVVDVDDQASEVVVVIHWKGGVHTELRLPRRRRGQSSAHTSKEIVDAVRVLVQICPDDLIAGVLNRNGLLTGRGNRWTQERVSALRSHHAIPAYSNNTRDSEGWMNLTQAAQFLNINPRTLRLAVDRGEIKAEHPLPEGPWILNRQILETEAAARFVQRVRRGHRSTEIPTAEQGSLNLSTT